MSRIVPSVAVSAIDRLLPQGVQPHTMLIGGAVAGAIDVIDAIPAELLLLEGQAYADFLIALANLKAGVQRWQADARNAQIRADNILTIRTLLTTCPDAAPSLATAGLAFIQDTDLRESLRLDISSANRLLAESEWKASTVLAGSVIESLLLLALSGLDVTTLEKAKAVAQKRLAWKNLPTDLKDWGLNQYLEVACDAKVLGEQTATQIRLAKDFRNPIHPGRAARLEQVCERGSALTALAAVEATVRELSAARNATP